MAVSELAQAVAAIVKSAAGDIAGFFEWANGFVADFGWGDEQSENSQASMRSDPETGTLIMISLTKTEERKQAMCPCFQGDTFTLTSALCVLAIKQPKRFAIIS